MGGKSLWWSWTAPASGPVTISTCGSDFDTVLAVYTGNAVDALSLVASNNNSVCSGVSNVQSQVQFNAIAGTNYQIAVDGFKYAAEPGARSGNITLSIAYQATAFAQWDFNSSIPDTNTLTGTLSPSLGSGVATYVGGVSAASSGAFAGGSAIDPNSVDNSGWNSANYPAQGTGNKLAGVQFNVSTVGRHDLSISWDQRSSATGSKYTRLQYSTNGVNFIDVPSATSVSAVAFESKSNNLAAVTGINDNPNFAFRIVAEFESTAAGTTNPNYVGVTSGYGTAGTIRFDMVTVWGTPIQLP